MGNHGAKTHPKPSSCQHCIPGTSSEDHSLTIDSKVISSRPQQLSAPVRKQRSPRETADLYVYLSYRNWDLARKQIEAERGLAYVSTNRKFSVLHVAVENNAPLDIVMMLLEKGLDPNYAESLFQQTPVHILMKVLDEGNSFAILNALVNAGADINLRAKYGRTALYCAIKCRVSERILICLLRAGASIGREELIFAREKANLDVALMLERVAILSILCCVRTRQQRARGRQAPAICNLPTEIFRELLRYLYR